VENSDLVSWGGFAEREEVLVGEALERKRIHGGNRP